MACHAKGSKGNKHEGEQGQGGEGDLAEQGGEGVQGILGPPLGLQGLWQNHLAPLGMTTAHMHHMCQFPITLMSAAVPTKALRLVCN